MVSTIALWADVGFDWQPTTISTPCTHEPIFQLQWVLQHKAPWPNRAISLLLLRVRIPYRWTEHWQGYPFKHLARPYLSLMKVCISNKIKLLKQRAFTSKSIGKKGHLPQSQLVGVSNCSHLEYPLQRWMQWSQGGPKTTERHFLSKEKLESIS